MSAVSLLTVLPPLPAIFHPSLDAASSGRLLGLQPEAKQREEKHSLRVKGKKQGDIPGKES